MSHPDPLREYHYDYHTDTCDIPECESHAHFRRELGACALCGLIQARHLFEVVDWGEGVILACGECVKREQLSGNY